MAETDLVDAYDFHQYLELYKAAVTGVTTRRGAGMREAESIAHEAGEIAAAAMVHLYNTEQWVIRIRRGAEREAERD